MKIFGLVAALMAFSSTALADEIWILFAPDSAMEVSLKTRVISNSAGSLDLEVNPGSDFNYSKACRVLEYEAPSSSEIKDNTGVLIGEGEFRKADHTCSAIVAQDIKVNGVRYSSVVINPSK